jgi:hypothetical protein
VSFKYRLRLLRRSVKDNARAADGVVGAIGFRRGDVASWNMAFQDPAQAGMIFFSTDVSESAKSTVRKRHMHRLAELIVNADRAGRDCRPGGEPASRARLGGFVWASSRSDHRRARTAAGEEVAARPVATLRCDVDRLQDRQNTVPLRTPFDRWMPLDGRQLNASRSLASEPQQVAPASARLLGRCRLLA